MGSAERASKFWPSTGFVLSAAVLGLFAGALLGRASVGMSDGLAGAATVLGCALLGLVLSVIAAIVLARRLARGAIARVLMVIGPLALILLGWSAKRYLDLKAVQDEQWEEERERMRRMRPTAPAGSVRFASLGGGMGIEPVVEPGDRPMGLGMASPHLVPGVLRLHGRPDLFDPMHRPAVVDSVVLAPGAHHMGITYAPPWFVPAHMKLDYDLLLLRVITLSRAWVEVEVNDTDGRTAWIERDRADVRLWPDLIVGVVAVGTLDPATNPVRIKPLDHATILADGADAQLAPLAVKGDWLLVGTHGLADRIQPTGWVRWREGERLRIRYSLLE